MRFFSQQIYEVAALRCLSYLLTKSHTPGPNVACTATVDLQPEETTNPIYLPEGGKAHHLPMFEIRAGYQSRTISFPSLSPPSSLSHATPPRRTTAGRGRLVVGWVVGGSGRRPAVVEVVGGGGRVGRRLGFGVVGWGRVGGRVVGGAAGGEVTAGRGGGGGGGP
jgi:hypothetical protein